MLRIPGPLRRRGFLALWLAQVVSSLGDRLYEIALIWLVYEQTGDPLAVSVVTFASVCSAAAATVPAGAIVDQVDRRWILVVSHLVRGGAVGVIPLLGAANGLLTLLVGVAVVSGVAEAFFGPAKNALIPELVPRAELDTANSIAYVSRNGSQVLYAVAGVVVGVLGPMVAFSIDAATFFLAACVLFAIPNASRRAGELADETAAPEGRTTRSVASLAEFRRALELLKTNVYLPPIIALSVVSSFAIGPIGIVIPFYIESIAAPSSAVFGALYAAFFVGMLLGGVLLSTTDLSLSRGRQITLGTIFSGIALVAMALLPPLVGPSLLVAAGLFLLSGVFTIYVKIPIRTYVQRSIPNEHLGKVLSLLNLAMLVAPPTSIVVAGVLLETAGPIVVLAGIGGLVTVAGLASLATPLWRAGEPGATSPSGVARADE
ncbi:MFS transporter [Halovivax limisalsi]|uniref:MFS transporter n=1 Tax=Halovivax limisalsi TaxID=1453760 RepID=UPI001FFD4407|nr:MFS transporter [Halovivax limisalsi]